MERVNLQRELEVVRRAVLRGRISAIFLGLIIVASTVSTWFGWIDGSKERNDSFDLNRSIV